MELSYPSCPLSSSARILQNEIIQIRATLKCTRYCAFFVNQKWSEKRSSSFPRRETHHFQERKLCAEKDKFNERQHHFNKSEISQKDTFSSYY